MIACMIALILMALVAFTSIQGGRVGVQCELDDSRLSSCKCKPCHVCEWKDFKCQVSGENLDDGSLVPVNQPILDPTTWFLTEKELTISRLQVPRNGLSLYTMNNNVTIYASTSEYFRALYQEIEQTGANDLMHMTGWSLADIPLDPLNALIHSDFQSTLKRAVMRGMDYRGIVWANIQELDHVVQFLDFSNDELPKPTSDGPGRLIFDDRLKRNPTSTHHQKSVILQRQNQLIAFLGGVDLTLDRWDTIHHDQQRLRKQAKLANKFSGWLDAEIRIEGEAARDVGANFLQRWNSKTKPKKIWRNHTNPDYGDLPPYSAPPMVKGTHAVQITRTYSCQYKQYEYAPYGERSILHARIKAIRQAQNYIFIEDQYFILVPQLLDALLEVLPRLQRLIVVVQRIRPNGLEANGGYYKYMYDMVAPLQKQFPNKFQFYTTKEELELYVHSKIVLIDDVYLSIGSSNWNRRSMTSDSEIGANIVDQDLVQTADKITVGKLPYDYRLRKFSEHTGKSYEELKSMTFIEAANALDEATTNITTILAQYEVHERPSFPLYTDKIRNFVDPDDTC